jgi:glutathione S-transferase
MGVNGREKACIEMWERRAYDEGLSGTAEVFRNSHPVFVDRGLQGSREPVPQIPALIERGKGRVRRFYRKFEDQLKDNQFVAGDRFTVADITTLCSVDFAKLVGLETPQDYPSVARWHEEVSARPAARASLWRLRVCWCRGGKRRGGTGAACLRSWTSVHPGRKASRRI